MKIKPILLVTNGSIPQRLISVLSEESIEHQKSISATSLDWSHFSSIVVDTSCNHVDLTVFKEDGYIPPGIHSFYFNFEYFDEDFFKAKISFLNNLRKDTSIHYRKWNFFAETVLPTAFGEFIWFGFQSRLNGPNIIGLRTKKLPEIPSIRTHSMCYTGDIFHSLKCDCREELENALRYIQRDGGVLIYPEEEGRGIGVLNKIKIYQLQNDGADTVEAQQLGLFPNDLRDYSYLKDVFDHYKITTIKLITNNPQKIEACFASGVHVKKVIKLPSTITEQNRNYLQTKMMKNNHNFRFEFGQE